MNKLLITVLALLAMSSICDAYGQQRLAYGGLPPAAAIVYHTQPAATLQLLVPASTYAKSGYGTPLASGYSTPLASGYGTPLASGYGTPLASGYGAPVIGLPAPSYRKLGPVGYDSEIIRLAELALSLPNLPAIINQNKDLLPSKVHGPAAPLILPAPISTGYKIPANAPKSASASAVADSAGNKLGNLYAPASVLPSLKLNIGPGTSYAPAPRPVILRAPALIPAASY